MADLAERNACKGDGTAERLFRESGRYLTGLLYGNEKIHDELLKLKSLAHCKGTPLDNVQVSSERQRCIAID